MSVPAVASWQAIDPIGAPGSLTGFDTTQQWPLGKRVIAYDQSSTGYGYGEFIYLGGVASTAIGDACLVTGLYATTRATARDKGAIVIALAANVLGTTYAWYQIRGKAIVNTATCAGASPIYLSATAGSLSSTAVAGDNVIGARSAVAESSGQSVINLVTEAATGDFDNA